MTKYIVSEILYKIGSNALIFTENTKEDALIILAYKGDFVQRKNGYYRTIRDNYIIPDRFVIPVPELKDEITELKDEIKELKNELKEIKQKINKNPFRYGYGHGPNYF